MLNVFPPSMLKSIKHAKFNNTRLYDRCHSTIESDIFQCSSNLTLLYHQTMQEILIFMKSL